MSMKCYPKERGEVKHLTEKRKKLFVRKRLWIVKTRPVTLDICTQALPAQVPYQASLCLSD